MSYPLESMENQTMKKKTIMGMNPMKVLFAMEYVLQGIVNPFQGINTLASYHYHPFADNEHKML